MARLSFLIPDMGGGGAERVAALLIRGFVERGHSIDLVVMQARGPNLDLLPSSVRIVELGASRARHALVPLVRYLRRERPDAMEVSMWPLTVIALLAGRLAGGHTRIVTADHTNYGQHYRDRPRRLALAAKAMGWTYPWAAARIAVSQGAATDLAALTGIRRDSVTVVPNPVPPLPVDGKGVAAPCWSEAKTRILSVGNLHPMKRHDLLVEAMARLDPGLNAALLILGEGRERAALEAQVERLGLAGRVFLPGYVSQLGSYYAQAHLFALSSELEGLPTVLIEALHAGLPIVSTDCPSGPREILEGGRFGRLVAMGDAAALASAMEESLRSPPDPERQRLRASAFAPDRAVAAHLALLLAD